MSINEITVKLTELKEIRNMIEELTADADAITDEIKTYMGDTEVLLSGPYKVTYKPVTTSRIDTTALKKELPDIAARYTKQTTTRRFTVN